MWPSPEMSRYWQPLAERPKRNTGAGAGMHFCPLEQYHSGVVGAGDFKGWTNPTKSPESPKRRHLLTLPSTEPPADLGSRRRWYDNLIERRPTPYPIAFEANFTVRCIWSLPLPRPHHGHDQHIPWVRLQPLTCPRFLNWCRAIGKGLVV